jgi:hypothetical protein
MLVHSKTMIILLLLLSPLVNSAQTSEITLLDGHLMRREFRASNSTGYLNDMNVKIVRHLIKHFDNPANQKWDLNKDGYRVKFERDSILYRVDYDRRGHWRNTIRFYTENRLPASVKSSLKEYLSDFNITHVTELKYQRTVSYFINLDGFKRILNVVVRDGNVELLKSFDKVLP